MIRERALQPRWLASWILFFPLAPAVALYEALQQGLVSQSEKIVQFSVVIVLAASVVTLLFRIQKQFDIFEPLHVVFGLFAVFYPVRALFAAWLDESWFDPASASVWKALWASVLGFGCFAAGYKVGQSKFDWRRETWVDRSWNVERANFVSSLFLLIGLAGFAAMRFLGGTLFYFITLDPEVKAPGEIKAWFFYLLWVCVFVQVGALIQLGSWFGSGRRTSWTFVYCGLALVSTFFLARYFTVLFLAMLALSWHYQKKKIKAVQIVALFLLVVVYLGVAGLYREWISPGYDLEEVGRLVDLSGQQKELALRYVVGNLEELYDLSQVIAMTPSEIPYQLGSTFTPVLLKPIPRALMPAKPLGASALFSQRLIPDAYDNGYVTALGAWGEWYLNFSWAGLVLGMILMGALTAAAFKAMRATSTFGRVLLYLIFVVALLTWLRNDFNSAVTSGLYYFIPAVLALAYITSPESGARQSLMARHA